MLHLIVQKLYKNIGLFVTDLEQDEIVSTSTDETMQLQQAPSSG